MIDIEGYWTGHITGTNEASFAMDLKQSGSLVSGRVQIHEPKLGIYTYNVAGEASSNVALEMKPISHSGNMVLGSVKVVASLESKNKLSGQWRSTIGTEGIFVAERFNKSKISEQLPSTNSVFIVHGHDEAAKLQVARFLEKINIQPVILQEQINKGSTVIEKFEDFASRAGYAVVLITGDDYGHPKDDPPSIRLRPRQNVLLELGYFFAKLGRERVFVLKRNDVELPSDIFGLVYVEFDQGGGWRISLGQELAACGYEVNMNNIIC